MLIFSVSFHFFRIPPEGGPLNVIGSTGDRDSLQPLLCFGFTTLSHQNSGVTEVVANLQVLPEDLPLPPPPALPACLTVF